MTPALVAAAIAAPLLRPEPWSAVALQQASSPDGALTGATAATGGRHTARASNGSRWPTGRPHARTLWACGRDGPGLSSLRAEDGRVPPRRQSIWSVPWRPLLERWVCMGCPPDFAEAAVRLVTPRSCNGVKQRTHLCCSSSRTSDKATGCGERSFVCGTPPPRSGGLRCGLFSPDDG